MKNVPLQTFFLVHAPLQIFFFEIITIFVIHIVFANNLFCFSKPCKQFFQYFLSPPPPPPKKKMVRPLCS